MKNSLPNHILENILRKEQLYNSFTAQEFLDHIVSDNHNSRRTIDSYDVHKVDVTSSRLRLKQEQPTFRREMQKREPKYRAKKTAHR